MRRSRPTNRDLFKAIACIVLLVSGALALTFFLRSRHCLDDAFYSNPRAFDDSVRAHREAEKARRHAEYEARRAEWAAEKGVRQARHQAWLDSQAVWAARRARWAEEKAERARIRAQRQAHYDSLRAQWPEKFAEGTVVDADDLIAAMIGDAKKTSEELGKFKDMSEEERNEIARVVGLGALKYFILKVDARKNMLFNPEESIDFNGNTGPFIQYTYARIRSILRKAEAEGIVIPASLGDDMPLSDKEQELIQKISEFGAAVEQAGKDYSPSGIANYCYELTKEFNQFYHDYSILGADSADEKAVRLVLAQNVAKTIKNGMALLGIEVPERM